MRSSSNVSIKVPLVLRRRRPLFQSLNDGIFAVKLDAFQLRPVVGVGQVPHHVLRLRRLEVARRAAEVGEAHGIRPAARCMLVHLWSLSRTVLCSFLKRPLFHSLESLARPLFRQLRADLSGRI